jgi:hypothetical protein
VLAFALVGCNSAQERAAEAQRDQVCRNQTGLSYSDCQVKLKQQSPDGMTSSQGTPEQMSRGEPAVTCETHTVGNTTITDCR